MKKTLILLLAFTIANTSFAQKNKKPDRFHITGEALGFTDSTFMYLSDLSEGYYKDIDSTYILNGKFRFAGTLAAKVVKFAIHTKGFADRTDFWVDNTKTFFSAEKGNFNVAVIKGSKAQAQRDELDSVIRSSKSKKKDYIKFIQNNPTSIVSADLLNVYTSSWNKDTVSLLYEQFSTDIKNTIYGKNISNFLSLNVSPKIGDKYVDFALQNMDGKTIHLSDFKNKIVLLEFWGSWCAPCREGHPELIKTYNEYKNKGVEILGVAADVDKKMLMTAIQKDSLPWENVSDLKGSKNKPALIYGVSGYPSNFLIDQNGTIIARDLRGEGLRDKLKELFK